MHNMFLLLFYIAHLVACQCSCCMPVCVKGHLPTWSGGWCVCGIMSYRILIDVKALNSNHSKVYHIPHPGNNNDRATQPCGGVIPVGTYGTALICSIIKTTHPAFGIMQYITLCSSSTRSLLNHFFNCVKFIFKISASVSFCCSPHHRLTLSSLSVGEHILKVAVVSSTCMSEMFKLIYMPTTPCHCQLYKSQIHILYVYNCGMLYCVK